MRNCDLHEFTWPGEPGLELSYSVFWSRGLSMKWGSHSLYQSTGPVLVLVAHPTVRHCKLLPPVLFLTSEAAIHSSLLWLSYSHVYELISVPDQSTNQRHDLHGAIISLRPCLLLSIAGCCLVDRGWNRKTGTVLVPFFNFPDLLKLFLRVWKADSIPDTEIVIAFHPGVPSIIRRSPGSSWSYVLFDLVGPDSLLRTTWTPDLVCPWR